MAMRNPNGYGTVVKLSGKRRRPYVVRKTVGYDDRAYPIYDVIGYYETRSEALIALANYNQDPYDVDLSKATMQQVYEEWSKEVFPGLKKSMKSAYTSSFKHCEPVYDKPYKSLRKGHMQACIDGCGKGFSTRSNIKMLFSALDKYAYDHDVISKCYSANLNIGSKEKSDKHTPFTDQEVQLLWKHTGEPYIGETLFLLYTGCRISEMILMETANVDLEQGIMVGGLKTAAGTNRTIPIHRKLLPIVKAHFNAGNKYLFEADCDQTSTAYRVGFANRWQKALKVLGINHLTHDCRHTVRSKLDSAGANRVAIDRIMGHSSESIGEKIYTHKTVEELRDAINLLSYE